MSHLPVDNKPSWTDSGFRQLGLLVRLQIASALLMAFVVIGFLMVTEGGSIEGTSSIRPYSITVDATALAPPTWWYVPGVTPLIWSLDPDHTEALRTTEPQELLLKPGPYRFGTFTFDFPFSIGADGKLDFPPSLDQCVSGRGTNRLIVRC
ncbi:MAG: hypothetical protein C4293_11395, partial [Nitrospiraceae bacterium]